MDYGVVRPPSRPPPLSTCSFKVPSTRFTSCPCRIVTSDHAIQMITTAFVSFILYSLIILRRRVNAPAFGWNFRLHRVNDAWVDDGVDESQMSMAGCCGKSPSLFGGAGRADVKSQVSVSNGTRSRSLKNLTLWLQVAYTIIIFPVAAYRLITIFGHPAPSRATMATDSSFVLSGTPRAHVRPCIHPPLPSRLRERRPLLSDAQDPLPRPLADRD